MTGRRCSYLQHWAPLHNMTVEQATSPGARWMTGSTLRMDGGEVKSI